MLCLCNERQIWTESTSFGPRILANKKTALAHLPTVYLYKQRLCKIKQDIKSTQSINKDKGT